MVCQKTLVGGVIAVEYPFDRGLWLQPSMRRPDTVEAWERVFLATGMSLFGGIFCRGGLLFAIVLQLRGDLLFGGVARHLLA